MTTWLTCLIRAPMRIGRVSIAQHLRRGRFFSTHRQSLAAFSTKEDHRCPTESLWGNIERLCSVFIRAALASRVSGFEIFQLCASSHSGFEPTRLTTTATPSFRVVARVAVLHGSWSSFICPRDLDAGQFGKRKPHAFGMRFKSGDCFSFSTRVIVHDGCCDVTLQLFQVFQR